MALSDVLLGLSAIEKLADIIRRLVTGAPVSDEELALLHKQAELAEDAILGGDEGRGDAG